MHKIMNLYLYYFEKQVILNYPLQPQLRRQIALHSINHLRINVTMLSNCQNV